MTSFTPAHIKVSWFFLIITGMVIGYSCFFYPDQHPIECIIKAKTGKDCPSCGISRSFSYFTHFRFREGISFNKKALPVFLFLLYQFIVRAMVIVRFHFTKRALSNSLVKWDVIISISGFLFAFLPLLKLY